MMIKIFVPFILTVLMMTDSVLSLPLEKKADISTFASAINNAGRLRYGKRSQADLWEKNNIGIPAAEEQYVYSGDRYPYSLIKRAFNTDTLVDSLNGAERLRFGRK